MAAFPHVFLNRLDYEHLCLRPTEHVRSTSQLLLLVTYQITAHDDSQKGTEKPTGPPAYTPVANQMYNWTKCGNKGVWGRPVICSPCCPQCLPKSGGRGGQWGMEQGHSLWHANQGPSSGRCCSCLGLVSRRWCHNIVKYLSCEFTFGMSYMFIHVSSLIKSIMIS